MDRRNAAQLHGFDVVQCYGGLRVAVGPSNRMDGCVWVGRLVYDPAKASNLAHLAKQLFLLLEQGGDFFQLSLRLAKRAICSVNFF